MSYQLELLTENPSLWTTVINVTPEIQKKEIKPFVILALKELEGGGGGGDVRTCSLVHSHKSAAVRAVVRHAARLRSAAARPWQQPDLTAFLQGLRFSPECVSELAGLLCAEQVYQTIPTHMRLKPAVTGLSWKVDLSLAGAAPRVIIRMELSDGAVHTYRLSISKFHELRFCVASALKSVIVLERRKCMRRERERERERD